MSSCKSAPTFQYISIPAEGDPVIAREGGLLVPDNPVVCYIDGDGVGREIGPVTRTVVDRAVYAIWGGSRRICWLRLYAGKDAVAVYNTLLPGDTLDAVRHYRMCLKGPLETPVGSGHRSLNVALRQELSLYANVRPLRHIKGIRSPVKYPERVDMVVFRENTEDVYAGIEWQQGSQEARELIALAAEKSGAQIPGDAGIGLKVISAHATKRLMRAALDYAFAQRRTSVTIVHKGNIMKYTEGAFRRWAYEVAEEEYGMKTITEEALLKRGGITHLPEGKLLVKDRLADDMFQQVLLYPENYDVIAAPNLTGDYLADALAAQVGGIGVAPGVNMGDRIAVFEPTHGTAPNIAGKNLANPTAMLLSAALMLEYMAWNDAAQVVRQALEKAIGAGEVTADLAQEAHAIPGLSTTDFVQAVLNRI